MSKLCMLFQNDLHASLVCKSSYALIANLIIFSLSPAKKATANLIFEEKKNY